MKTILTRHTTSEWNLIKKMQGQTDIELAPRGKEEAAQLAQALSKFQITAIHSSDLKRAHQTARIISEHLALPIVLDQRLRECAFGTLEGLTRAEAIAQHENIAHNWDDQYLSYDFRKFGGESRNDVLARHMNMLVEIKHEYPQDAIILLVGHGRGLNTLLAGIGQMPTLKQKEYRTIEI